MKRIRGLWLSVVWCALLQMARTASSQALFVRQDSLRSHNVNAAYHRAFHDYDDDSVDDHEVHEFLRTAPSSYQQQPYQQQFQSYKQQPDKQPAPSELSPASTTAQTQVQSKFSYRQKAPPQQPFQQYRQDQEYKPQQHRQPQTTQRSTPQPQYIRSTSQPQYQRPTSPSQYQKTGQQSKQDNGQYKQVNSQYRQENGQYRQENGQYRQENGQYRQEKGQYRQDTGQYRQDNGQYRQDNEQYKAQESQYQKQLYKSDSQQYKQRAQDPFNQKPQAFQPKQSFPRSQQSTARPQESYIQQQQYQRQRQQQQQPELQAQPSQQVKKLNEASQVLRSGRVPTQPPSTIGNNNLDQTVQSILSWIQGMSRAQERKARQELQGGSGTVPSRDYLPASEEPLPRPRPFQPAPEEPARQGQPSRQYLPVPEVPVTEQPRPFTPSEAPPSGPGPAPDTPPPAGETLPPAPETPPPASESLTPAPETPPPGAETPSPTEGTQPPPEAATEAPPAPETPAPETLAPENPLAPDTPPTPGTPAPETPAPAPPPTAPGPAPETPAPETPAPETPARETQPPPTAPAEYPSTPLPETPAPEAPTGPAPEAPTGLVPEAPTGPAPEAPPEGPAPPGIAPEVPPESPAENPPSGPETPGQPTTPEDEGVHPPHIHAIEVQCARDMMTINIEFDRPYDGIIYSKGYYRDPNCRYVMAGAGQTKYSFTVMLNSCGTQFVDDFTGSNQAYLENVIVLQNEEGIQEVWDSIRSVRCLWEGNLKQALSVALSVGSLSQEIVTFGGDTGMARLDIQMGRGPFAPAANGLVKIGEVMTLVVSVEGDPNFDVQVRACAARDADSTNVVQLTDDQGCVLKPKLLGAFQKTKETGNSGASIIAYAFFNAFKFPDVMDLIIECSVDLCKKDCEMCPNPNQKIEPGRRRRRSALLAGNMTDELGTIFEDDLGVTMGRHLRVFTPDELAPTAFQEALVEAPSPLVGNEMLEFNSPTARFDGVCVSTPRFLVSSAVLLSVLLSSCSLSIILWIKLQRSRTKKLDLAH